MPNHAVTKTAQPNSSLKSLYPPARLANAAMDLLQSASLSCPRGDLHGLVGLRASAGGSTNSYIAFSAKDHGTDADEIAPTLLGMGDDASHANGDRQLAIAFTLHGSDGTASIASSTDVAGSLRTRAPGSIENSSTTAVLQEQSVASSLPPSCGEQIDHSYSSSGSPNLLHAPMAVRRLTPRECERLQGFPDDYTLVEYRGKLAADGPRYRSLGNSMAVPVMRWIGERIAAVDAILRDGSGVRRRP
jgi:DNA (cytosine-5)-methyltransferase 1